MFNKKILLSIYPALIVILAGMIIYPEWWATILSHGLPELIYQASVPYLPLTATITITTILLLLWYHLSAKNPSITIQYLNIYLGSKIYFSFLFFLMIFATGRVSIQYIELRASNMIGELVDRQSKDNNLPPFESIVDFVFINENSLSNAYDQIEQEMKLQEKTVGSKTKGAVTAEGGIGKVAEATIEKSIETETNATYIATKKSYTRKTLDLINYLHSRNNLVQISSIDIQSEDLKNFDDAVQLLKNTYKVTLSSTDIALARKGIIEKNISVDVPKEFKDNSWILLKGKVTTRKHNNSLDFIFDYVPSLPSRVNFFCRIEINGLYVKELASLTDKPIWSLNMFGKIVNTEHTGTKITFLFQPYAIFR